MGIYTKYKENTKINVSFALVKLKNISKVHYNIEDYPALDLRILICELQSMLGGGLYKMIHNIGLHDKINIVMNLKDALERIKNYEYDLIIIGIHDDNTKDLAIIEGLIEKNPAIKIIIMSNDADAAQQLKFRKMGIKGYIKQGILQNILIQLLLTVYNRGKYFDLLDEDENKKTIPDNIEELIKLGPLEFLIIRETPIGTTSEGMAKLAVAAKLKNSKGKPVTYRDIENITAYWRDILDVDKTMKAINIMDKRGWLKRMDVI